MKTKFEYLKVKIGIENYDFGYNFCNNYHIYEI